VASGLKSLAAARHEVACAVLLLVVDYKYLARSDEGFENENEQRQLHSSIATRGRASSAQSYERDGEHMRNASSILTNLRGDLQVCERDCFYYIIVQTCDLGLHSRRHHRCACTRKRIPFRHTHAQTHARARAHAITRTRLFCHDACVCSLQQADRHPLLMHQSITHVYCVCSKLLCFESLCGPFVCVRGCL